MKTQSKITQEEKDQITKIKLWMYNPIYFFEDCILTVDEARGNLGLDAIRPLPVAEEYIQIFVSLMLRDRVLLVNKSRRMMATWIMMAFALWKLLFFADTKTYVVSRKADEADDLLTERIWFMYEHIPEDFKKILPKMNHRKDKKYNQITCPEMNSFIKGIASGSDQIRGKTASLVLWDEASSTDYILKMWGSLSFTIKGGGQVVICSTPRLNEFMTLWEGLKTGLRP